MASIAASGLGFLAGHAAAGASRPTHPSGPPHTRAQVYVVEPGDTLWTIAARVVGPGADPRPVVDALIARNHIADAAIRSGQVLRLPVAAG